MNSVHAITLVGFVLVASASPVEAQQTAQPKRIGFAWLNFPATNAAQVGELREGLREHGWIEGQDVVIESRYAEGNLDRFAEIAAELVRLPVDVLVTAGVRRRWRSRKRRTPFRSSLLRRPTPWEPVW